jgi:hypothetical protein
MVWVPSMSRKTVGLIVAISLVASSCRDDEPYRKPTYPVRGVVTVDGVTPDSSVQVQCHNQGPVDAEHPTYSQAETNPDGSFAISTYELGDGLPAGQYVLTFSWQTFDLFTRGYTGPDKLNGRYSDPQTSPFKLDIKEGSGPIDMGEVKLTTK